MKISIGKHTRPNRVKILTLEASENLLSDIIHKAI